VSPLGAAEVLRIAPQALARSGLIVSLCGLVARGTGIALELAADS
jgi:hypothetical protein